MLGSVNLVKTSGSLGVKFKYEAINLLPSMHHVHFTLGNPSSRHLVTGFRLFNFNPLSRLDSASSAIGLDSIPVAVSNCFLRPAITRDLRRTQRLSRPSSNGNILLRPNWDALLKVKTWTRLCIVRAWWIKIFGFAVKFASFERGPRGELWRLCHQRRPIQLYIWAREEDLRKGRRVEPNNTSPQNSIGLPISRNPQLYTNLWFCVRAMRILILRDWVEGAESCGRFFGVSGKVRNGRAQGRLDLACVGTVGKVFGHRMQAQCARFVRGRLRECVRRPRRVVPREAMEERLLNTSTKPPLHLAHPAHADPHDGERDVFAGCEYSAGGEGGAASVTPTGLEGCATPAALAGAFARVRVREGRVDLHCVNAGAATVASAPIFAMSICAGHAPPTDSITPWGRAPFFLADGDNNSERTGAGEQRRRIRGGVMVSEAMGIGMGMEDPAYATGNA
ncbi:hypothetical protein B0H16DRAFT_1467166 [Mycena metata]|uniref:Uncharacterized protein n=1 Tax=Mycena metata TaxID=1033252 RepID=A0AAD7MWH9_9AGAR|nr:hypothetical protein B0H16DRAFT_1467166 [Mycena metata]